MNTENEGKPKHVNLPCEQRTRVPRPKRRSTLQQPKTLRSPTLKKVNRTKPTPIPTTVSSSTVWPSFVPQPPPTSPNSPQKILKCMINQQEAVQQRYQYFQDAIIEPNMWDPYFQQVLESASSAPPQPTPVSAQFSTPGPTPTLVQYPMHAPAVQSNTDFQSIQTNYNNYCCSNGTYFEQNELYNGLLDWKNEPQIKMRCLDASSHTFMDNELEIFEGKPNYEVNINQPLLSGRDYSYMSNWIHQFQQEDVPQKQQQQHQHFQQEQLHYYQPEQQQTYYHKQPQPNLQQQRSTVYENPAPTFQPKQTYADPRTVRRNSPELDGLALRLMDVKMEILNKPKY